MEFSVRAATPADAAAVAAVHVAGWRWAYDGLLPPSLLAGLSVAGRTEQWSRTLSGCKPGSSHLVADTSGAVIGFASVGACRDEDAGDVTGELYAIYLVPEVAGRGVGSRLHDEGMRRLAEAGFADGRLWVLATNERARRFYERKGWVSDETVKQETFSDGSVAVELRYRRPLADAGAGRPAQT